MAAEVVGGALLSSFLQVLFDRMASKDVLNFFRGKKSRNKPLNELKAKLRSAESLLNDAEEKQIKNERVRKWLAELKEVIYDADDLVSEINLEALRCEIEGGSGSTLQQVLKSIPTPFTAFNEQDVESKIEEILDRVESILQQKDFLNLKVGVQNKHPQRPPSPCLVQESDVYGRDDDKKAILDLLLSDAVGGNKISVIPIVGMGGIGKTTLAQFIYTNDDVKNHFKIRAWANVSNDFDVFRTTKIILESITQRRCDITDLNRLQENLKQKLMEKKKKFLFVLDDVWNENYIEWDTLRSPFEFGACGSKIIVTTRSEKVANMVRNVQRYTLKILSEGDDWLLFVKHAFGNIEADAHPDLVEIGKELVRKCQGLPLAVKSLGGLVRNEEDPEEWGRILKNDIWESSQKEHNILPSLWLSYYYLPQHLKRCFAYCSIFPKDYEFEKKDLILLWMGENLLEPHKKKTAKEVGEEYFNDLLSRSLFQGAKSGRFTLHDLINDLAMFVSGDCFRLDDNVSEVERKSTRHLSGLKCSEHYTKKFDDLCNKKRLRTLLLKKMHQSRDGILIYILEQLQSMPYLRVLEVCGALYDKLGSPHMTTVLNSIANLKLLRHLRFEDATIKEIPDSVCTLDNLQTLILRDCGLARLPDSIGNLKHLQHLDLGRSDIRRIPDSIGNLKHLQHLDLSGCKFKEIPDSIGNLEHLRYLDLSKCHFTEIPDSIGNLKHLRYLDFSRPTISIRRIPDSIGNLEHLRYLDLSGTNIEEIPDTVRNLHELRTLKLYSCCRLKRFPNSITTLINLRHLGISHDENSVSLTSLRTELREMPPDMWKLKNLQTLPVFVIGNDSGANIKELGELRHQLGRRFLIKGLENVINKEDASGAKLEDKKHISELGLVWTGDRGGSELAREVLDRLQPHTNLEILYIGEYGGTSFPPWVGHHSFFCIKSVRLSGCKNCCWLPALGQLPSLESLHISGFNMLGKIGNEFYSDSDGSSSSSSSITKPFKSLKSLKFENMAEWREWSVVEVEGNREEGGGVFSNLKKLELSNCPKLKGECFPDYLPSLETLSIRKSDILAASLSGHQYPSLPVLKITSSKEMKTFPEGRLPSDIQSIEIGDCNELASLSEEGWPSNLKSLIINSCPFLFVRSNITQWNLGMLTSLTSLHIQSTKLVVDTFPEKEGQLPTSLTSLYLHNIPKLESLHGKAFQQLTSLRNLSIYGCEQLQCLPEERLPASISQLEIIECPLLTPRCQRETGEDWPKIHHIPSISIDFHKI